MQGQPQPILIIFQIDRDPKERRAKREGKLKNVSTTKGANFSYFQVATCVNVTQNLNNLLHIDDLKSVST